MTDPIEAELQAILYQEQARARDRRKAGLEGEEDATAGGL